MNGHTHASGSQRSRRITVVIPSFNHAQFIGEAIGSVLAQTHRDIELHVLDDGSTDGSPRVIEQALSAAPAGIRCEFTARGNRGCSATLNELIAGVRSDWVAILNSDDSLAPIRFEQMLHDVPEQGHHLGFSAVEFLIREGAPDADIWREFYPAMFRGGLVLPTVGFALLRSNFAITSSNFLFDRSLFDRVGGFREELPLSQDWDFLLRALRHVEPVFHPELLLRYRVHETNTYRNHRGRQRTELRLLFEAFGAWASDAAENRLAPTPLNWPRLFPVFSRACRLGTGEPIGTLLPPQVVRPPAKGPNASILPDGFEALAIKRLLSGGARSAPSEAPGLPELAGTCHAHWSAVRDLLIGSRHRPAACDGVFSWSGASVRVTSWDRNLLQRIAAFTGLEAILDAQDPGRPDLLVLDERTVRIHSADRSEARTFGCPEDLWAWLALSVSDLLAVRARLTLVHGASFLLRDSVVLLCGEPWSGKSTFSLRALESGLSVLGDDLTWIDPSDGTASPCPRPVKRRVVVVGDDRPQVGWPEGSFQACLDGEQSLLFPRCATGFVPVRERHPVRWVIHLSRKNGPGLEADVLGGPSWAPALQGQLRNFSPRPDQAEALIVESLARATHIRLSVGEGEVDAAFRWLLELR